MQPTPWCNASDIAERWAAAGGSEDIDLDFMCQVATNLLFELSGRRFNSLTETVRPARADPDCSCWAPAGATVPDVGRFCGCSPSAIVLPEPVIDIDEVVVDGLVLVAEDDYTVTDHRLLVRMINDSTPGLRGWPCCQDLSRPDGELGTFHVTLSHGQPPNDAAVLAAREFAFQLALGWSGSTQCKLPSRVVSVTRQGVTMTVSDKTYLTDHKLGIAVVDMFLEAYNPARLQRRPSVASPDTLVNHRTA